MLQPIITSGIKIKTTFDTSTPAITATMSPIPATMANTPKTFSPVRRTDLGYPRTTQLRGGCPRSAPATCRPAPPVASGLPRSRSGVGEGAVCGFAGTSSTTEVLLWTIRRMGGGLGPGLLLLGIAMLVNFERYRCVAAETLARRPIYSDGMTLRGVRRVRNTGSPWRGHQPHVKCGLALDAPPPRSRQRRADPRRDGEHRNAWREPPIRLRLARWFRR